MLGGSLDRKTVVELKKMLSAKGISDLSGRKADLIARLNGEDSDDEDDKIVLSAANSPAKPAVKSASDVKKGGGMRWVRHGGHKLISAPRGPRRHVFWRCSAPRRMLLY